MLAAINRTDYAPPARAPALIRSGRDDCAGLEIMRPSRCFRNKRSPLQYRIDLAVAAVLFLLTSRGLAPRRSCTRVIRRQIRNFAVSDQGDQLDSPRAHRRGNGDAFGTGPRRIDVFSALRIYLRKPGCGCSTQREALNFTAVPVW